MPVTRDQATRLLTQAEMGLFGDSRNPALRALTASGLAKRVERVRKLRDKARDLLQRQRLSSRDLTGSKRGASGEANERTRRKGEVLADILQRFEDRLKDVERAEKLEAKHEAAASAASAKAKAKAKPAVGKTKASKAPAPSPRAKKAATASSVKAKSKGSSSAGLMANTAGRGADAKASGPTKAAKRTAASPTKAAKPTAANKAGTGDVTGNTRNAGRGAVMEGATPKPKPTTRAARSGITPGRALANTRALLEAKQQHDAEPKSWQALAGRAEHAPPDGGFQSGIAAAKAEELHAGESRMTAIEGSISTRGRQNQGKRDHR